MGCMLVWEIFWQYCKIQVMVYIMWSWLRSIFSCCKNLNNDPKQKFFSWEQNDDDDACYMYMYVECRLN